MEVSLSDHGKYSGVRDYLLMAPSLAKIRALQRCCAEVGVLVPAIEFGGHHCSDGGSILLGDGTWRSGCARDWRHLAYHKATTASGNAFCQMVWPCFAWSYSFGKCFVLE